MDIKERLTRISEKDKVYFGDLMERFKQSEEYDLFKEVTLNKILNILAIDVAENAERTLGTLKGLREVYSFPDLFIQDRDFLLTQKKEERKQKKELSVAEEPEPKVSGGSI